MFSSELFSFASTTFKASASAFFNFESLISSRITYNAKSNHRLPQLHQYLSPADHRLCFRPPPRQTGKTYTVHSLYHTIYRPRTVRTCVHKIIRLMAARSLSFTFFECRTTDILRNRVGFPRLRFNPRCKSLQRSCQRRHSA